MQSRGWGAWLRLSWLRDLLRTEGGPSQEGTEGLLEGDHPLSHQQQDQPDDVSGIPRLLHLHNSKLDWVLAELPHLEKLAEELGIGALHLY